MTASASIAAAPRELRVGVYSNEPKVFVDADGKAAGICSARYGVVDTGIVFQPAALFFATGPGAQR